MKQQIGGTTVDRKDVVSMNSTKEKCPGTAATVQSTSNNIQFQNITKQDSCKSFSDTNENAIRATNKVITMKDWHYQDGFKGKPYCNEFTYAGFISMHGEPADSDKDIPILQSLYHLCDKMFRESWERGRADATDIAVGA